VNSRKLYKWRNFIGTKVFDTLYIKDKSTYNRIVLLQPEKSEGVHCLKYHATAT